MAPKAPQIFLFLISSFIAAEGGGFPNGDRRRPDRGAPGTRGAPIFFFLSRGGAPTAPKGGAGGATPPEGEGNPAEGGSSRVYYDTIMHLMYIFTEGAYLL